MRGDLDAIGELLDPDVKWHAGDPSIGCQDRKQTLRWMRQNWLRRGAPPGEVVEMLDAGDKVVVIMRRTGEDGEPELVANLTTFRDGKVDRDGPLREPRRRARGGRALTGPARTAPLTGAEYLESLRDGREVWIDGERVRDVTEHPAFRNSARSVARLYDALHDPSTSEVMTAEDRHGIRTHRFFMPSYSPADLLASREAIAQWARMSYGYMGRTPDYKASFMATLGADPEWYAPFGDSARHWYRTYAEQALFLNHVLINPPIDRDKAVHEVEDVYVHVIRERDDGIIVSGAKMLATGSAVTHATFVAQNSAVQLEEGKAEDYALVFIAPMDTPGKKLISRNSYESAAGRRGTTRCRRGSTRTTPS